MSTDQARAANLRVLLDRVRADRHPSQTHMDLIEQTLPREAIPDYVGVLLEKIADEPYPSITMLRRIQALINAAA